MNKLQAQARNEHHRQQSSPYLEHSVETIEAAADLFEAKLREKGYTLDDIAHCLIGMSHTP